MRKQQKAAAVENVTYLLALKSGGMQKVTVPAAWKVTFGPIAPGSKNFDSNGAGGMCLRFYEGPERQRAVFTNVVAFRDMAISIEERITKTQQQRATKQTPRGAKDFVVEATVHEWRNPDNLEPADDEFTALPKQSKEIEF